MKKFEILIIDDEPLREKNYREIFNYPEFSLSFIFRKEDFIDLILENYDCFVIDISLDGWVFNDLSLENEFWFVVEKIGKDKPLVLVSSQIETVISWSNKLLVEYNLIYTIALKKIQSEVGQTISSQEVSEVLCNNISLQLNKIYKYSTLKIAEDRNINILHISDLQFGSSEFQHNLCNGFPNNFYRYTDRPQEIDFIALSGDISQHCLPSEFDEATKWISKLCERVFGTSNFHDRLIITPGNHDINMSLSALNKWEYDFPKKDASEDELKNVHFKLRDNSISDFSIYASDPFRDFAYKLTKDNTWLENPSLTFFNHKFLYLGIQFLHLNCLELYQAGMKHPTYAVSESTITILQDNFFKLKSKKFFTIIIVHCPPNGLGFDISESHLDNQWKSLDSIFLENNSILYVNGHSHADIESRKPLHLSNSSEVNRSSATTLFCTPEVGETRGFNIISLKRTGKSIIGVDIQKHNLRNDGSIEIGKLISKSLS